MLATVVLTGSLVTGTAHAEQVAVATDAGTAVTWSDADRLDAEPLVRQSADPVVAEGASDVTEDRSHLGWVQIVVTLLLVGGAVALLGTTRSRERFSP